MMGFRVFAVLRMGLLLAAAVLCGPPAHAQDRAVPYWASLRYEKVNMRVGPSREYPIEWIYQRKGLPVKVMRVREGWRLVRDADGAQGWVAASQLTPERGVMVTGPALADLRSAPDGGAMLRWRAEPGVVAKFLRCRESWCEIDVAGRTGWVEAARLWGSESLPGDE